MSQWTLSHYFWTKVWCKTCWSSAILTLGKLFLLSKAAYIFSPTLPAPLRSLRVDRWHLLLAFITYINKIITIWVNWSLLSMYVGWPFPPYTPGGANEVRHTNMAPTYLPKPIFTYIDIHVYLSSLILANVNVGWLYPALYFLQCTDTVY